jgi:uncharacterized protein
MRVNESCFLRSGNIFWLYRDGEDIMMHVGVCQIKLRMPESHSLKEKRHIVKSIVSQVKNKFEVSIAEVDNLDSWQIVILGLSCVSNDSRHANEVLSHVVAYIQGNRLEAELVDYSLEVIPFSDMKE